MPDPNSSASSPADAAMQAFASPEGAAPPDPIAEEELTEERWLNEVYQGDHVPQLTPRAVITGMMIGGVMSVSNLYVGLRTGWGLGVTITACIIAYAVFKVLQEIVPAWRTRHFSILENYTMSSAASAAGYMASAGLVSAIPALQMITGRQLLWWEMMLWLASVSLLGVFMAVPLKRQMINSEKLPFPSGIATAETLKSMHTAGAEAVAKAKSLFAAGLIGALIAFWRDAWESLVRAIFPENIANSLAKGAMPAEFPLLPSIISSAGHDWLKKYTIGFEGSLIMLAAGAIMGIRVGLSLLFGAILYFGILGPWLVKNGLAQEGYRGIVTWTLWPATSLMVTNGLLAFAFKWRTVLRAFSGLGRLVSRGSGTDDRLSAIEVPGSWFLLGTLASGAACVIIGHWRFEISWWWGIVAVLLTFILSIVAARATGETDVTPIGAMGKITQLLFGLLAPGSATTNLMTASITAGAASHSADLLTDLKSGYLLGGNPRKQLLSQLFGVLAGTLVCVPIYAAVVKPEALGTASMPAPAAQVWRGVAELMTKGESIPEILSRDGATWTDVGRALVAKLPPHAGWGMLIGAMVGVVLSILEEFLPKPYRQYLPSATGLGIAGVVPAFNSISMFCGALIAWVIAKKNEPLAERYTVPVSSGLIAGESLMGVAIILVVQGPALLRDVWNSLAQLFGG